MFIASLIQALEINLNTAWYGTFAEIGAGQEVARWFFHVGGAAGTVNKIPLYMKLLIRSPNLYLLTT